MKRLLPALGALTLVAALATACGDDRDDALVQALTHGTATSGISLYAPTIDGDGPRSFTVDAGADRVILDYGKGFTPTLTLRAAPKGDLCAGREPEWDECRRVDDDAVRLSFEEMDAVVVRRGGTELFWSNLSFEVPDEEFANEEELRAAIAEKVTGFITAAREAHALTPREFIDEVPRGSVTTAD